MFTERFFVEGLAHASYLFGSDGQAAVVDPKRDVEDYIEAAERHGAKIVAIFETHPHADFVSGHLELSERTDAPIYVSERLEAAYLRRALADGDQVRLGSLTVTALHTPGHSPDSMSFYVEGGERPAVYTGDILFVGDVGRPDLRDATADPREMAEALYDTLFDVLFRLPEETVVYPAHGAGSLCGRKIGTAAHTTIGAEKRGNWAVRFPDRDSFVRAMLSNLPDRPAYFTYDVGRNQKGAKPLSEVPKPKPVAADDLRSLGPEVRIVDARTPEAYGEGHLEGSLNIGVSSAMFTTWTGFFVDPEAPIYLVVGRRDDAEKAWLELARIGYENVKGFILADTASWERADLEVRRTPQMDVCDVSDWLREGNALLDVRTAGEWNEDHVEGAVWVPLPTLPKSLDRIPEGEVAVMCGSGYRSSLAASLLERAGREGVVNVTGGWSAWVQRPCIEPDATDLAGGEKLAA